MQEDYYKPTNIRDTIFASFDLPQQSGVQAYSKKLKTKTQETIADKYGVEQENDGDDSFANLGFSNLKQISNIQPKSKYESPMSVIKEVSDLKKQQSDLTRANSAQKQAIQQKTDLPKITLGKKPVHQIRRSMRNKPVDNKVKKQKQKAVIDLDTQIGEVRQWAHRDDNQKESDFDEPDKPNDKFQGPYEIPSNKKIQEQLKKKAEEKARMLQLKIQNKSSSSQPKGLGLAAKAEELKRKNEQLANNATQAGRNRQQINMEHEQSSDNLKLNLMPQLNSSLLKNQTPTQKQTIATQPNQQQSESQDDPWQKINQQTIQQFQKKQQLPTNLLSKDQIIDFYSKKFIFNEEDVINQFQLDDDLEQEKQTSCWEALFSCLKSQDDGQKQKGNKKNKDRIAMRLLAISKINLSNTEEEFFILKEIWNKLTNKTFSRYGNHWNEIGFQGRDPATDLRSTGVLSILQWYLFIQGDLQSAKIIFDWASEKDFPLALTHIKTTGMFLKLIKNGKIRTNSWNEYQKYYNCIISGVFNQIQKQYDPTDNIGETVDKNLQAFRKNLSQRYRSFCQTKKS